jgi:uncharacterized protein (TIGR00290 family)
LLSWSSGKDSAWCLEVLRKRADVQVVGLLTTFAEDSKRVSMHAVRSRLVEQQAEATGLPLVSVHLPSPCPNAVYEQRMAEALQRAQSLQVDAVAFGDLFLQDVRQYRERQLQGTGLEALFPLWERPTRQLAREMTHGGLKARITCVDSSQMDPAFIGGRYDAQLVEALPEGIDPCGERGEFHTFVYQGPMFQHSVAVRLGEVYRQDPFIQVDLLPAHDGPGRR